MYHLLLGTPCNENGWGFMNPGLGLTDCNHILGCSPPPCNSHHQAYQPSLATLPSCIFKKRHPDPSSADWVQSYPKPSPNRNNTGSVHRLRRWCENSTGGRIGRDLFRLGTPKKVIYYTHYNLERGMHAYGHAWNTYRLLLLLSKQGVCLQYVEFFELPGS